MCLAAIVWGVLSGFGESSESRIIVRTVTVTVPETPAGEPADGSAGSRPETAPQSPAMVPDAAAIPQPETASCIADYKQGYEDGHEERFDFQNGFQTGYNEGYDDGYEQGSSDFSPIYASSGQHPRCLFRPMFVIGSLRSEHGIPEEAGLPRLKEVIANG